MTEGLSCDHENSTVEAWRGRPKVETLKVRVGFRLAADVVEGIEATRRGYNGRVEKVLRDALAHGELGEGANKRSAQ